MIESTAAKELVMKLRKLWDNDNYVKGIIAFAKTEKILSRYLNSLICPIVSYLLDVLENKS